ncbi:MAG: hypothetical protein M3Q34_00850 [bacterium]|nr:hypothetical protein [bacterium]
MKKQIKLKFKRKGNVISFKKFTDEENLVWKRLCERQLKNLKGKASKIRVEGWKRLKMDTKNVPDFEKLNKILKKFGGWEVVMTNIQYEEGVAWVTALNEKKFRVTDYIRESKNLGFTPLPDIFHDVFGHVPFFTIPQYSRIVHKFGMAITQAKTKKMKDFITNNWWYALEFSLIRENGKLKALGTGLVSSGNELKNALSSRVQKLPYDPLVAGHTPKNPHEMHKTLFVLESLDQLEAAVDGWL